jgi:Type I restriction-modification system methyltransferase subunit
VLNLRTEEDVKVKYLLPLLEKMGYISQLCEFEKAVEIHEGRKSKTIYADIVVYSSAKHESPLLLCETKGPNEVLDRHVKEQAISYARLMPKIVPLVLITNGSQLQVYETLNKTRLSELPQKKDLKKDVVHFLLNKELQESLRSEARRELFIIDDVSLFKNILKSSHNEIRNNEGYDPTVAFDEMSKVLFCKLYEEKHSKNNRFTSAIYDDSLSRLGVNVVKQIFEETKADPRYSNLFLPNSTINLQDRTIRKIVTLFEGYDFSLTAFDIKGESFEYFLGDTFTGGLGEYFTPRNIVEFIVDAVDPKIGDKIVDPFCGTGGFLIYAFETVSKKIKTQDFSDDEKEKWKFELSNQSIFGTDWKERTSQSCKMNMMVHGDGSAGIFMHHGLVDVPQYIEENKFNICFTNPPFGSFENDPDILKEYELGSGKNSQSRLILGIERAIKLVKIRGLIGIVVIDGILNNDSMRYVRDYIKKYTFIRASISLAKETFEGYGARAKTSILLLQKKENPSENDVYPTFFAMATNTGYAPNGSQIPGNELPDILFDYKSFVQGETEFKHSNGFIGEIADRLDAEYYIPRLRNLGTDTLADTQRAIESILDEINSEYTAVTSNIHKITQSSSFVTYALSELLEEVGEKEALLPQQMYKLLGVRWWGGGAFIREEKRGKDIKAKYLFTTMPYNLIYNRLFAFRGSFAILGEEHSDGYVSNEFPMFSAKADVIEPKLTLKYIVHCLNSPHFLNIVDKLSTGSTKQSRNRFSQKEFLKLKVSLPQGAELRTLVELLDKSVELRFKQEELSEQLKSFQEGVAGMLPNPNS